jgi:hypothetical protein
MRTPSFDDDTFDLVTNCIARTTIPTRGERSGDGAVQARWYLRTVDNVALDEHASRYQHFETLRIHRTTGRTA